MEGIEPGKKKVRIQVGEGEFVGYVEVPVSASVARWSRRAKSPWLPARVARALIFDHHGPLSNKRSASVQAREWLRRVGAVREPLRMIVTEPPLDADMVTAITQIIQQRPAPKPLVEGIDVEDRKSAVGLWARIKEGKKELGAAVPVLRKINELNEERGGPWFSDTEEFAEALKRAMEAVSEVIEDIKDGEIDPVKEGERWAKEFEEWAEKQCRNQDIIEETVIAGYKVTFAEAPPTALYVKGTDVAVSYGNGRVTVGISPISDLDVDLRELFEFMNEKHRPGWGGRPDVGGSPKDYTIDRKEFEEEIVPLIKRWLERKLG